MDELKLIAFDSEDLTTLSAHMQDAIIRIGDIIYLPRERRFVAGLSRLGADIQLNGELATIRGKTELKGAEVMATDLRASVSLVIAGLVAEGDTMINRVYHLDRGFEQLEQKLRHCGARIERLAG